MPVPKKLKPITSFFLVCTFLVASQAVFGQNPRKRDSLLSLNTQLTNKKEKALVQLQLAQYYQKIRTDSSRYYINQVEDLAHQLEDDSLLAASYFRKAYVEYFKANDDKALAIYDKIDSLYKRNKELIDVVIESKVYRAEISRFSFTMEGVLKAKEYLLEGISLAEKKKNEKLKYRLKQRLAAWHGFIASEVAPEKHIDSSNTILKEVLPYFQEQKDWVMVAETYKVLTFNYEEIGPKSKEQEYSIKQLEALRKAGDSLKIGEYYYYKGAKYRTTTTPDIGLAYLDTAKTIYETIGYPNNNQKKNLFRDYGYLFSIKKDYEKAFDNMRQALIISNKVYNEKTKLAALDLEVQHETEQRKQKIALLEAKNETVEAQKTNQRNVLLGGIGITTFAGIFMFLLYRNRQKTNKKLRELDTAKSNFFANISHELRTPLALIATPIQEKLQRNDLPEKERKEYELILRNNGRLTNLVDQLLDLSKLESGNLNLKVVETSARSFLEVQLEPYRYFAKSQELDFQISMNLKEERIWIDPEAIQKILSNLFSNAIKYCNAKGMVKGYFKTTSKGLSITVKNSADPLTTPQKEQLFNRFYQADEFKEGAGIGLALVKELVQLHKGKIDVGDEDGFVIFRVILPCHKSNFKPQELYKGTPIMSTPQEPPILLDNIIVEDEDSADADDGLPLLLIVEDNLGLRTVLRDAFKKDYRTAFAVNGGEGVQKAIELVPDLIISDVMMPIKNGVELTKELKAHALTSHIPIILLTAKAGDENELVGIESGADDYITKPFNNTLLKSKMANALRNRQKMRDRYSQEVILRPQDIAVTPPDELFLERIQSVLDTYLMEASFSTEDFAKEMGFSRMQLHRKLKALTGLSATEFIRSQRLKLAAQLLQKSEANVSEVCYQTGFNNLSYFSKCFKKAYGTAPSQYAKKG